MSGVITAGSLERVGQHRFQYTLACMKVIEKKLLLEFAKTKQKKCIGKCFLWQYSVNVAIFMFFYQVVNSCQGRKAVKTLKPDINNYIWHQVEPPASSKAQTTLYIPKCCLFSYTLQTVVHAAHSRKKWFMICALEHFQYTGEPFLAL